MIDHPWEVDFYTDRTLPIAERRTVSAACGGARDPEPEHEGRPRRLT
jgi:hypothetical protein